MAGGELFWPATAQGWVGLLASITGLVVGFAKWGVPVLRRTFGRAHGVDVRVKVKAGTTVLLTTPPKETPCLQVTVQNHSPAEVHVTGVSLRTSCEGGLWSPDEVLTGKRNAGSAVKPGDSYSFSFDGKQVLAQDAASCMPKSVTASIESSCRAGER